MGAVETLAAVGLLIEKIRLAGIREPIEGPELRALAEIAAEAQRDGSRVTAVGAGGTLRVQGRWPVHPMAQGADDVDGS
jgi:hypothetical protein